MADEAASGFDMDRFKKLYADLQLIHGTIDQIHEAMHSQAAEKALADEHGWIDWSKLNTSEGRDAYMKALKEYTDERVNNLYKVELPGIDKEYHKLQGWINILGVTPDQYRRYIDTYRERWDQLRPQVVAENIAQAKRAFEAVPRGMVEEQHYESLLEQTVAEEAQRGKIKFRDTAEAYSHLVRWIQDQRDLERQPYYNN